MTSWPRDKYCPRDWWMRKRWRMSPAGQRIHQHRPLSPREAGAMSLATASACWKGCSQSCAAAYVDSPGSRSAACSASERCAHDNGQPRRSSGLEARRSPNGPYSLTRNCNHNYRCHWNGCFSLAAPFALPLSPRSHPPLPLTWAEDALPLATEMCRARCFCSCTDFERF